MKSLTLTFILVLLFTFTVSGIDMWKLAFNSAVETDRYQSYNWNFSTEDNPIVSPNGYKVYEINPLVAGTTRQQFDTRVSIAKITTNNLRHYNKYTRFAYKAITIIEIANIIRNNLNSVEFGFEQIYMISYNFRF